mmetsp:Transcript_22667/g.63082  ORF Transcript_22667/g.63082 Transcript_22667/m.63082 type:complete len:90 (-) Transcript_22667:384-653(-)
MPPVVTKVWAMGVILMAPVAITSGVGVGVVAAAAVDAPGVGASSSSSSGGEETAPTEAPPTSPERPSEMNFRRSEKWRSSLREFSEGSD